MGTDEPEQDGRNGRYDGVNFSPFEGSDQFSRWLATNHGTNVRDSVYEVIDGLLARKEPVSPLDIFDDLKRATRQVDVALNDFRAQFVY